MTSEKRADLIERVRSMLSKEPTLREVSMFGGRSFMVHDRMVVSARKNGDLLVRVAVDQDDELMASPGAHRAEMGAGRSMGVGWISVTADSIASDEQLSFWLTAATVPVCQHPATASGPKRDKQEQLG